MNAASITLARGVLLPALQAAKSAVERRSTIPILQNMLVAVEDGMLRLTGTDLDVEITAEVPCAGAKKAAFTLPATLFHDAVRKLPEASEVTIEADAQNATISSGRSRFKVPVLPVSDFPQLSAGDMPNAFDLPAAALARIIDAVSFAISTEETRYYLNGIHMHQAGDRMVAVATDGHRLSKIELPLPEGADGMPGIIVPRRTVGLLKGFGGEKSVLRVEVSAGKIRFTARHDIDPDMTLTSKLIDGTFPDYQRVVPPQHANRFLVEREALSQAVDRVVTISAGARGSGVRFSFAPEGLSLGAVNPDLGSAEDQVSLAGAEGDAVETGFNGRYCLDLLSVCPTERLTFMLADAGAPVRVEPEGQDDQVFVLMPMRIGTGG